MIWFFVVLLTAPLCANAPARFARDSDTLNLELFAVNVMLSGGTL
jgi:hypothetical protein